MINTSENRYQMLIHLGQLLQQQPQLTLVEALSQGQISSKSWLIAELEKLNLDLGVVFILGGWWGFLPAMMFESRLNFTRIRSFDRDPDCAQIADTLNRHYVKNDWLFKASTMDIYEMYYENSVYWTARSDGQMVKLIDSPNTIVNTVCEHLGEFRRWWNRVPFKQLTILQSNNFFNGEQHVNCVTSLQEFQEQAPMSELLFAGEMTFAKYTRYMLIGYR